MKRFISLVFVAFTTLGIFAQPPDPSTARIVFTRGGNIWMMRTDGSGQQQLTSGGSDRYARLSNNGVLVFLRGGRGGALWRGDTNGDTPVEIPNTAGVLEYDVSPDGTQLVLTYIANNNFTLFRMDIDGTNQVVLNTSGFLHQLYPSWGRDGHIYFGQTPFGNPYAQALYRIDPDGTGLMQLTNYFTQVPRYGLASGRVVFVFNQPAPILRTMASDGSNQTDVPNSPAGINYAPAPDDGQDVIYFQFGGQIWRIGADGSGLAPLAAEDIDEIDFGYATPAADTTPPTILSVTASPNVLWPPNHKMVPVTITVNATDNVDPNPVSQIVAVKSNQAETSPDWVITGPLTLQLRAERSGEGARTYTITVRCSDASGNAATADVTVTVPHDQR
jgi:hypothetical protein